MIVKMNSIDFEKKINNLVDYSLGFIDGIYLGKNQFLNNLGKDVIKILGQYIDVEARANPQALHHVYEWYQTGSPNARIFDLNYTVSNLGLSLKTSFRQSKSFSKDSNIPFYDKARIMENGVPVKISPKRSTVLSFEADGEQIFTKKTISVKNPGGTEVVGSFEKTIDLFINTYLRQSFLSSAGLYNYIKKPVLYKMNIKEGVKVGKSKGVSTGYKWIINARIGVE